MKRLLVLLLVFGCVTLTDARTTKEVKVSYETRSGWSDDICRDVVFFSGSEIDTSAAFRNGISFLKNYAAIWFSEDEVALVELKGVTWLGDADEDTVTIIGTWKGEDQSGRTWRFKSGVFCSPSGSTRTRPRRGAPPTAQYPGLGGGHWITEVRGAGEIVELEDGSLWEISAVDRIYTGLWLPVTEIAIVEADEPIGPYRYVLVNTDDREAALARYLGSR